MKLNFPHYDELKSLHTFNEDFLHRINSMMCEKILHINKNPLLTKELVEEHLHLDNEETTIVFPIGKKEAIAVFSFNLFELVDCQFEIRLHIYYDKEGKTLNYTATHEESLNGDSRLMEYLKLNQFNKDNYELTFHLQKNYHGESYCLKTRHHIRMGDMQAMTLHLTYHFDQEHNIFKKTVESKYLLNNKRKDNSKYTIEGLINVENELLLLSFIFNIVNLKSEIDPSYINYDDVNFQSYYWFKVIQRSFEYNMKEDRRVAFLDYLTVLEMLKC